MPNRRVVTKSVAQPLFANKSNGPFTTWQTLPLYLTVQKADKASSYFPLCSDSDAEESHLSTTALLFTPSRVGAISCISPAMTEFSQLAFFYHHQLLPAGFTAKSCTTRLFCTSYQLIKSLYINKLKHTQKISRYVVHIVMKKVVHSEISVYSFGVLTACCATKRGSLTIAQRVGRWFPVIHFLFVTWRVSTVRCDFYCLFALYVGEFELCILKIPFQQSLSSIRP